MKKQVFKTNRYPLGKGPYSQAIKVGQFIFVSGTGPLDAETNTSVGGDIKRQTKQVLDNIENLLGDAGTSMANVLKVTVFLKDMNHYASMNEVYRSFFPQSPPARTCVQVAKIPGDHLVEMDVIALLPE